MCQYSDGIFYNSEYSRSHMANRFPKAKSTRSYVFGHSLDPRDYVTDLGLRVRVSEDYIFVVGNWYEHKHLRPTVDLLSSAFPFQHFKVLGLKYHIGTNVHTLPSGRGPAAALDALFAGAKMIVFPSLYEGFGLPIVKGLSYGRTVLARSSELLLNLAGQYRGPGKLIEFSTPFGLVNTLGQLLHGNPVSEVSLGSALKPNGAPKTWRDVAEGLFAFIEAQMGNTAGLRWMARDQSVRQLEAFCLEVGDDEVSLSKR